jgi:hypothetical protein
MRLLDESAIPHYSEIALTSFWIIENMPPMPPAARMKRLSETTIITSIMLDTLLYSMVSSYASIFSQNITIWLSARENRITLFRLCGSTEN